MFGLAPELEVAIVGAAGILGGTVLSSAFGRGLRKAQTDAIRQDIYQQLTADLRTELDRVKKELHEARERLEANLNDEDQLRRRISELENRVSQLAAMGANLEAELRATQTERDQLKIQLAAKEATITELKAQITDLRVEQARLQGTQHQAA